ncbi:MAG: response regulator transcription factor [Saprospiraceae bacterium]|jgi:DNA-binding NarL/FixJ family response regulator|nr:MAG: DNA-binding response regulator [Bacteroidota bacterium]
MAGPKVLIADAESLVRIGLKYLLAEKAGCQVVGEATNEQQLQSILEASAPEIVILDYNQPGHFSPETLDLIRKKAPKTKLLIISGDQDKKTIYEVLETGVNSYLSKHCDEKEILDAVDATARGDKFYCTNVLNHLLEKSFPKADKCEPTPLSAREIEIVQLVAEGLIAKEIADRLHLSTHTVYTHRKNIMKKLKLGSTSELVRWAIEEGIV